jgi:hypothetical protein
MREYEHCPQFAGGGQFYQAASHPFRFTRIPVPRKFGNQQVCLPEINSGGKSGISNRLANRQCKTIRIAPKPFGFGEECSSNRSYIAYFRPRLLDAGFAMEKSKAGRSEQRPYENKGRPPSQNLFLALSLRRPPTENFWIRRYRRDLLDAKMHFDSVGKTTERFFVPYRGTQNDGMQTHAEHPERKPAAQKPISGLENGVA